MQEFRSSMQCNRTVDARFDYLCFTADARFERPPLLVYLHGAGTKETNLDTLARCSLPLLLSEGLELPAMVVCPLAGAGPGWPVGEVAVFIEEAIRRHGADPLRVYLTGESMGGRGAFEVAYWHHPMLAAILPLCAFGIPNLAPALRDLPIWMFHGTDDEVLPIARSDEMAAALAAAGLHTRFTRLEGHGHDIGREVYQRRDTWAWLFDQCRTKAP